MKKNHSKKMDQKQEEKPRRLTLSRETIQVLNDPALFGIAGGAEWSKGNNQTATTMGLRESCNPEF